MKNENTSYTFNELSRQDFDYSQNTSYIDKPLQLDKHLQITRIHGTSAFKLN